MALRINMAADLEDLFGGQLDFEVAISMDGAEGFEIVGAGHSLPEAIAEARATFRGWAANEAKAAI